MSSSGIGGGFSVVGAGGSTSCPQRCSADLKQVLDCKDNVIETCPMDDACLDGKCGADPCTASAESKSSYGCDYWTMRPDLISIGNGACFAIYVANTWDAPVHIEVLYDNQSIPHDGYTVIPKGQGANLTYEPYDPVAGLPVGQVAIVFLNDIAPQTVLPICPFKPAVRADIALNGTGRGKSFQIKTDRPAVAYSILPFGGGQSAATSASLLLPSSVWDTNYIGVNAYAKSQVVAEAKPSMRILAKEDNTKVTLLPKVAVEAGPNVVGSAANTPVEYTLNKAEYLQFSQDVELTGSVIQSDKPVAVWGGASCLNIPVDKAACDSAHQQIPPVKALGSEYVGVRHRNRAAATTEESPPWRFVGAVDGTQLTYSPAVPAGAPTTLNQGEVAEFNSTGPFVVRSQDKAHPFYAAQYMMGQDAVGNGEGDPEWVNMIPAAQYLKNYIFFTDPTYSETNLVVARSKSKKTGMFEDVFLKCKGKLDGWVAVGDFEYTRVDLVTGNFMDVGNCSNGQHSMNSEGPFGVTVWGWGMNGVKPSTVYVSYAYPAGASIQSINEVVVVPTPK